MSKAKELISNKLAKTARLLPVATKVTQVLPVSKNLTLFLEQKDTQSMNYHSPHTRQRRPGTSPLLNAECRKGRPIIEVTLSVPTSSTTSPDVAVS